MNIQKNNVFISWQSQESRLWHVVGNLDYDGENYTFRYTNGSKEAKNDGFTPFQGMDDLDRTYTSFQLFPLFQNRVLSKRRPEYPRFISWLRLNDHATEMDLLERSNGIKITDNLQTFSRLEVNEVGEFDCCFFVHGLSHRSEEAKEYVNDLSVGNELFLQHEPENDYDSYATLVLRPTGEGSELRLGYCPGYLSADISHLLNDNTESMVFTVESVNESAPIHYRLMCRLKGKVKPDFNRSSLYRDEFEFVQEMGHA